MKQNTLNITEHDPGGAQNQPPGSPNPSSFTGRERGALSISALKAKVLCSDSNIIRFRALIIVSCGSAGCCKERWWRRHFRGSWRGRGANQSANHLEAQLERTKSQHCSLSCQKLCKAAAPICALVPGCPSLWQVLRPNLAILPLTFLGVGFGESLGWVSGVTNNV